MNRFFAAALAFLLLLSCTACVGRAASPEDSGQTEPLEAAAPQIPAPDPSAPSAQPEEAPAEQPYVRVIDPSKPMVALTFDDGPDGTCSDRILDVLEENHALATFFEVGRNVLACPEPVARMVEMGGEVASHSNAHKNLSKLKKATLLKDLATADEAFAAAGAEVPTLVRPPYGAVNKTVKNATGRAMITWTIDTEDWRSRDAQTVADYVMNYGDLDGEIILMHSIYESTADATAILVPWLVEQGYQLVTVTELMAFYYGELPQPDHFYGYTYFATHGRTDTPIELPSMFPPVEEPAPEETPAEPEPLPEETQPSEQPTGSPEPETEEDTPKKPAPVETPEPQELHGEGLMPEWLWPSAVTSYVNAAPKPSPITATPAIAAAKRTAPKEEPAKPKEEPAVPRESIGSNTSLPNPAIFSP